MGVRMEDDARMAGSVEDGIERVDRCDLVVVNGIGQKVD